MGVVIHLAKQKAKRRRQDPLVLAFRRLHRDIARMGPVIDRLETELTRNARRARIEAVFDRARAEQSKDDDAATPPESAT